MRPLFTTKGTPDYIKKGSPSDFPYGIISVPLYCQISGTNIDELVVKSLFISVNDPDDHNLIDEIIEDLTVSINDEKVKIQDQYSIVEANSKALNLLDLIFYVVIGILMFLCFFSLQAAMTANLYEQTKEIGVLRSIGFTAYRISTMYFYEALLLVFASCMLGVMIGVLVGFTMVV